MDNKIVSFKEVKYIAMYKEYYSKPENRNFARNCFLHADVVESKKKAKIS